MKAAALLTIATGALVALQAPINSKLGRELGTFQAASVSFAIGLSALLALAAVTGGGLGDIKGAVSVPWWYLLGGLLGAAYVTSVLITVRTLGAGGVTAATISGQLSASVVVDHYGWLGVDRQPITTAKMAGILLLAAGVVLIVKE